LTSPSIRIVTLRRAAKNVPIPSALDARQRARAGIAWILKSAEKGRKGGASQRTGRIAKEVLAVLDGSSAALTRKDEVHRQGAVNRWVQGGSQNVFRTPCADIPAVAL
jgi:small subunit ribosomal protein S7